MSGAVNIDRYFERIGYEGPVKISLDTLQALHKKHAQTIPFENLNPLLGIPVNLDIDSLEQKIVNQNRGGYCFEQNLLFLYALKAIGFKAKGLAARIRWNKADNEVTPLSHMLLLVEIGNNQFLADVGFGNNTLTGPLLLAPGKVQQTPHEPRRIIRKNDNFLMQILIDDEWKNLYQFDLREHFLPDYKITNWYLSNHPESHFVTGLIAARPEPGRRYTLRNNIFSIHHINGETEKKELKSVEELREVLEKIFLLQLPDTAKVNQSFSNLLTS